MSHPPLRGRRGAVVLRPCSAPRNRFRRQPKPGGYRRRYSPYEVRAPKRLTRSSMRTARRRGHVNMCTTSAPTSRAAVSGFAHLFEHLMFRQRELQRRLSRRRARSARPARTGRPAPTVPITSRPCRKKRWTFSGWNLIWMGHFIGALTQAWLDEQRGVVRTRSGRV